MKNFISLPPNTRSFDSNAKSKSGQRGRRFLTAIVAASFVCQPILTFAQPDARPVLRLSPGAEDVMTMDPHRATSGTDVGVVSEIFSALVRFPPGSANPKELEGDLAESWETSKDNTTWTFKLRRNVKFHGEWGELTASDVAYSLRRSADPKRSGFASTFAIIESAQAVDPYTVLIKLRYPDPDFLGRVSNYHGGFIVSEKAAEKLGAQFGTRPIGTGPFAFGEHVTQQYVKLVANDQYFRGKPKLSGITYRMIPSDSGRELAFNAGEIDVAFGKSEQRWVERVGRRTGTTVDVFRPGFFYSLHINQTIKPLDDIRVRKAISMSLNIAEIQSYAGLEKISTKGCSVVPPGYLGEDCSSGTYKYSIVEARKLLSEAGYPNGITVKAIISNQSGLKAKMEIVQSQLAKSGINVDVLVVDHSTYHAQNRKDLGALVLYGAARFPTADAWFTDFYDSAATVNTPTAISNFSHCSVADSEIRAARGEPDSNKRAALWSNAQRKIKDTVCAVPMFEELQVWVHSSKVSYSYDLKGSMNLTPPITEKTTIRGPN